MNPILFFTAFLGVFILINMYISKRLIAKLDIKDKYKLYLRVFLIVNFFGIIGYMLGRYYVDIPNWLYFLFSLPIGILFLLFCTAIIYDISRVILHHSPISQKRRNFFKRSLDISSLVVASSLSARAMYEARYVKLEKVNIKIKNLKKPYKIVQLSDIHIGGLIDKDFIHKIVQRVNALNPDLVVITGDLVDIDVKHAKETLDELKGLNSKYGTFFIVGNHEYFHGIATIIETVKALGIRVLENENVYIGEDGEGFNLAGVYDVFGYRTKTYMPDIDRALHKLQESPTILLAHQPRYIEEVKDSVDLILSGHTHGGQLYPFKFLVNLVQPYISGLHQHNENLQIYVNKGTGFWGPPMRLGASSEITDITIIPL
ncbi:metallophosphoesterase [Sulfurimonas gotlandica GD1]|uniref:Metallophosphoesterase n=1 Tax=Sulfurimonas gotlandica (strain DSM 19862 / JCM 16533 / GD1) TaxID=929558 RepID=B6BLF3_SULGG|nr:metallophosphoesterase [Sulfurimonas gotlandica]EDZ62166.1 integral membrane protein [Sulfurimonas gotlandica GD1]EHP28608.1 metallophosphoesterase [Sulfurimonas gotlandica GD1]